MKYAPMIIPTLCRYEHLKKCIESLKNNSWAQYTDVYIALDYPCSEDQWEGYLAIKTYLKKDFSEFNSFSVIERDHNYGPFQNHRQIVYEVLKKYDRFIRTDDDTVFSSCFLEFIDKALEKYEQDGSVIAITGYCYPCDYVASKEATVIREKSFCPMWGTAFWKESYLELEKKLSEEFILHRLFQKKWTKKDIVNLTDARFIDYVNAGLSWQRNKFLCDVTDIAVGTYVGLSDKFIIYPTKSMVRNNGYDGSGVTCPAYTDKHYALQEIIEAENIEIIEDETIHVIENRNIINSYDKKPKRKIIKAWIKVFLYRVLGHGLYKWLWFKYNKSRYEEFLEEL